MIKTDLYQSSLRETDEAGLDRKARMASSRAALCPLLFSTLPESHSLLPVTTSKTLTCVLICVRVAQCICLHYFICLYEIILGRPEAQLVSSSGQWRNVPVVSGKEDFGILLFRSLLGSSALPHSWMVIHHGHSRRLHVPACISISSPKAVLLSR